MISLADSDIVEKHLFLGGVGGEAEQTDSG
jgi:hypothetical protein